MLEFQAEKGLVIQNQNMYMRDTRDSVCSCTLMPREEWHRQKRRRACSHSIRNPIFSALIFIRRINELGIRSSEGESRDVRPHDICDLVNLKLKGICIRSLNYKSSTRLG